MPATVIAPKGRAPVLTLLVGSLAVSSVWPPSIAAKPCANLRRHTVNGVPIVKNFKNFSSRPLAELAPTLL